MDDEVTTSSQPTLTAIPFGEDLYQYASDGRAASKPHRGVSLRGSTVSSRSSNKTHCIRVQLLYLCEEADQVLYGSSFKVQNTQGGGEPNNFTFNTGEAKHMFCTTCGVQSFYIPRGCPNDRGIILYCLDAGTVESTSVMKFDGKNFEEAIKLFQDA